MSVPNFGSTEPPPPASLGPGGDSGSGDSTALSGTALAAVIGGAVVGGLLLILICTLFIVCRRARDVDTIENLELGQLNGQSVTSGKGTRMQGRYALGGESSGGGADANAAGENAVGYSRNAAFSPAQSAADPGRRPSAPGRPTAQRDAWL